MRPLLEESGHEGRQAQRDEIVDLEQAQYEYVGEQGANDQEQPDRCLHCV